MRILLLSVLLLFSKSAFAVQTFPYVLNFVDEEGEILNLNRSLDTVTVRLYSHPTLLQTPLYIEYFRNVDVKEGRLELEIGINPASGYELPDLITNRYIEVSVRTAAAQAEEVLQPRQPLISVPLALTSVNSQKLGGYTYEDLQNEFSAGHPTNTALAPGSVISGGNNNVISQTGDYAFIGGGENNFIAGQRSFIPLGRGISITSNGSFLFSGMSENQTVTQSEVISFSSSSARVGIGTTAPVSKLHVEMGAVCVSEFAGECSPAGNYLAGSLNAKFTSVMGLDYAEYFYREDGLQKELQPGDLVGINPATGKVRLYQPGDNFLGISSANPGVIGNAGADLSKHVLVGLLGQLPFCSGQVDIRNGIVFTKDGVAIGYLLYNNQVYLPGGLRQGPSPEVQALKKQNEMLLRRLEKLESVNN
jgi:hypothetical protein